VTTPEIGELIDGRYRLDDILGQGGMATVYGARDTRLDRPVAIKVLRSEALADPELAIRFRREAHAATVLRHPNVVACLDVGTHASRPYLVMELVEGEDLATRIRRDAPLPIAAATRIAADVALGLGVAHARGYVHRDVKPGNILLAADGRAMVTDFGIARLLAEAEVTMPGTMLGSVHYLSPEQVRGGAATAASDVYGVGLVLYELSLIHI
jgi:serine/threonine-protein kinase